MHLDFFTYNKPGVENLPCAYWVFSNWYATLSASRDGYSQAVPYRFSYAFFLPWTSEAINKQEKKKKVGLSEQHQSSGAGNRKQLPEEANTLIANSTSKRVMSSS